jgi:predicted permease
MLSDLLYRDLVYAARQIRRAPGFFGPAILLISLGVAINTQIFSLVDAVLLRQLPVRDPGSLVQLFGNIPALPPQPYFEYGLLRELQNHSSTLTGVIGQIEMTAPLERAGTIERIHPQRVTPGFFRALGVAAAQGRMLADDDRQVAVLSHEYWKSRFGGDPKAIGQTVMLYDRPFTIVGIAPESFVGTVIDSSAFLWVPLASAYNILDDPAVHIDQAYIDESPTEIIARLRPGITLEKAQTEAALFWERYKQETIRRSPGQKGFLEKENVEVRSLARGTSPFRNEASTALWLLLGGAVLLLLMVSANVGSLLLARASSREKEAAIMLALGASRARIARLWVTESVVLTMTGGAIGIWAAWQSFPLWVHWLPPARGIGIDPVENRTRTLDLHPDARIAVFAIGICVIVAVLSSLAPALRSARRDLWTGLKIAVGDARHRRFQSALCALQIALCTVILVFSALMVRSLTNLRGTNMGFDPTHVAVFAVDPLTTRYTDPQIESLERRLLDGARTLPGVTTAAVAGRPLMHGIGLVNTTVFPDRPPEGRFNTSTNMISPGYFDTMGIHIVSGRALNRQDGPPLKPVPVVVNQAFSMRFYQGRSPLGQVFANGAKWVEPQFQIVGVVNDTKYRSLREIPPPVFYSLVTPSRYSAVFLHVRTTGDARALIPAVDKLLASIDPRVPFYQEGTLEDDIDRSLWQERMLVALGVAFGGFAVVLAVIGLYGILAYFIAGRRREIGLRMALGAVPWNIGVLLLKQLLPPVVIGLAAGAAISLTGRIWVRSLLYDVSPSDPHSLAFALGVVLSIALTALAVPAWRALRVDPASTLREE